MKNYTLTLCCFVALFLSACSFRTIPVYEIEQDKETGIIYNKEWKEKFSDDMAYYNSTRGKLNVRSGPGADFSVIAYLKPNEGGFIQQCNFDLEWCFFDFGGAPESGWVSMQFLEKGEIEYKR